MKKMCDCSNGLKGIKNTTLLYFIVFLSTINIIWFFYYNFHSIIIFFTCCLAIYLISKNMIYVLSISLFITDILYLVNKKLNKYEGFEDDKHELDYENFNNENDENFNNENDENFDNENDENFNNEPFDTKIDSSNNKINQIETKNIYDASDNDYMQDKNILNKLKKLDPNILNMLHNTIENMNSTNIKEINKTINELTNKQLDT